MSRGNQRGTAVGLARAVTASFFSSANAAFTGASPSSTSPGV